jgi:hypothetical protein
VRKEIPLIETMRQLRRLHELDLLSPQCNWEHVALECSPQQMEARRVYFDVALECRRFELKHGL